MAVDREGYEEEHAGQDPSDKQQSPAAEADKDLVTEVIQFRALVESVESQQRKMEDEAIEFEGLDAWGTEARDSRAEHKDEATGDTIPAKPTLSVLLTDQPLQQLMSEARSAKLGVTVKPKTALSTTKIATYFKGLIRSIQIDSGAAEVRMWALERTAKAGRSNYLIRADYANDGDFDIDLIIERLLDGGAVFWDPFSVHADRSDATACLTIETISKTERLRRWKDKPVVPPDNGFQKDDAWFSIAEDERTEQVTIGTYHKVEFEEAFLAHHETVGSKLLTEMPPEIQALATRKDKSVRMRPVQRRRVQQYIVDGSQILEKHEWKGRYIPVIPSTGKEYLIKGKRYWKGMVTNAMDIVRAINVIISAATELAGNMPRAPYLMYAGQDDNFTEMWDEAFTKNRSRLYINPIAIDGKIAPLPQRQQLELQVQGLMLLLRMLQDMFHSVVGVVPPSNRAVNPYDRSGKAIEALQRQGAAGTSNYLDNLATISMMQEGRVLVDAIPHYYDREGRILMVSADEGEDETAIMIKRPFILQQGMPVGVPCPQCLGKGAIPRSIVGRIFNYQNEPCPACKGSTFATKENMPPEWQGEAVEYVDFGDGQFKVVVALDKNFQARQEEALAGMTEFMKAAPELVPRYADLLVRAMGFSGANEIADRIKPPSDDDFKNAPPAIRAKVQAMQMEHQQLMQAFEEAQKLIEGDVIKNAGAKELATIKAAAAESLEKVRARGKVLATVMDHRANQDLTMLKGQMDEMQAEAERRHEILLQLLKEKGEKEVERHSVALHDEAAAVAHQRLEASADTAATRELVADDIAHKREEDAANKEHVRTEVSANAAHQRSEVAAETAGQRSEEASVSEHTRAESSATHDVERQAALESHKVAIQPKKEPPKK